MAENEVLVEQEPVKKRAPKKVEEPAEELDPKRRVPIKLFKDKDKYNEPLYVRVGDYNATIPRGIEVPVPYFVKKHIEEMEAQDNHTAAMIADYTAQYEQKANQLN